MMVSDAIALSLSFLVSIHIRLGDYDYLNQFFYLNFLWVPLVLLILVYVNRGLYPGIGISSVEEWRRLFSSTTRLFLIMMALTFLMKNSEIFSRLVFVLAWLFTLFLLPLFRYLMRQVCIWLKVWGEPVGIVGFPDRRVTEVADFFIKNPQKGILPRLVFLEKSEQAGDQSEYQVQPSQHIFSATARQGIRTMLVVVPNWNWVGKNIDRYRYTFERVFLIQNQKDDFSLSTSTAFDFNGEMGFQVCHNLLNPWAMTLKRAIDVVVSAASLVLLFPLLAAIAIIIRLDSPGNVFYRQERVGKGGKMFRLLKFRTMYINNDQIFEAHLKKDKNLREEWKKYQKLKADPRVTRVGAFIRKYSLDELPQLWNILQGEMSLVGPRPIMVSQKQMYGLAFHDYCQIWPGVTGLWQVSGRNHTTFARRTELDMEYIQRWSIWLDLFIILLTIREVISRDGAY